MIQGILQHLLRPQTTKTLKNSTDFLCAYLFHSFNAHKVIAHFKVFTLMQRIERKKTATNPCSFGRAEQTFTINSAYIITVDRWLAHVNRCVQCLAFILWFAHKLDNNKCNARNNESSTIPAKLIDNMNDSKPYATKTRGERDTDAKRENQ